MKIKSIELDKETFADLLISALGGGSNYWYIVDFNEFKNKFKNSHDSQNKNLVEKLVDTLYFQPSYEINIYDVENVNKLLGRLSYNKCVEGLILMAHEYPRQFALVLTGEWDDETSDIFLQLSVLGKLVFG
jgi:hypothetical protein